MLDLKEGDILTVSGKDYPIKSVAEWAMSKAATRSFARLATVSASTKRSPGVVSGKRGAPVTYLTDLACTPLDPVDADVARRMAISTPYELKQTFIDSQGMFYLLILEELKV